MVRWSTATKSIWTGKTLSDRAQTAQPWYPLPQGRRTAPGPPAFAGDALLAPEPLPPLWTPRPQTARLVSFTGQPDPASHTAHQVCVEVIPYGGWPHSFLGAGLVLSVSCLCDAGVCREGLCGSFTAIQDPSQDSPYAQHGDDFGKDDVRGHVCECVWCEKRADAVSFTGCA